MAASLAGTVAELLTPEAPRSRGDPAAMCWAEAGPFEAVGCGDARASPTPGMACFRTAFSSSVASCTILAAWVFTERSCPQTHISSWPGGAAEWMLGSANGDA